MAKKVCQEDKKKKKQEEKPKFTCKSCGAIADREKYLCKPKKK